MKRHQHGLGAITIIVVLVVLAGMAAAIVRLNSAAQTTATQELLAARAAQAARAGLQWGLYQAFKGSWTACNGASSTLDLGSESGMRVTVSCSSMLYNEGEAIEAKTLIQPNALQRGRIGAGHPPGGACLYAERGGLQRQRQLPRRCPGRPPGVCRAALGDPRHRLSWGRTPRQRPRAAVSASG